MYDYLLYKTKGVEQQQYTWTIVTSWDRSVVSELQYCGRMRLKTVKYPVACLIPNLYTYQRWGRGMWYWRPGDWIWMSCGDLTLAGANFSSWGSHREDFGGQSQVQRSTFDAATIGRGIRKCSNTAFEKRLVSEWESSGGTLFYLFLWLFFVGNKKWKKNCWCDRPGLYEMRSGEFPIDKTKATLESNINAWGARELTGKHTQQTENKWVSTTGAPPFDENNGSTKNKYKEKKEALTKVKRKSSSYRKRNVSTQEKWNPQR